MWQRHFSADIAEKNGEVYSLIKKIYAKLFPQVYTTYLWCYRKSFFTFSSCYTLVLSSSTSRFSDFPLKILLFFFVRFVLKELIQTERDYVKSLGEVVEVSLVIFTLHPLSPIIHIQILQTDLHTFPLRISWENLMADQSIFSLVIIS